MTSSTDRDHRRRLAGGAKHEMGEDRIGSLKKAKVDDAEP
jgi:hypothetical protein